MFNHNLINFLQVKVMLKICPTVGHHGESSSSSFLSIDPRKKQVTVYDGAAGNFATPSQRRGAPKMFAFDAVFSPDDSQVKSGFNPFTPTNRVSSIQNNRWKSSL